MGNGSTRSTAATTATSIIDYDDAVSRMGNREVATVEEGFARLTSGGLLGRLDWKAGFLGSFAGPMPEALAAALFRGFDADASGELTVQEFICGLAVLRHGTPEEKMRLLFAVYDADRDQRLSDQDMASFAKSLSEGRTETVGQAIEDALSSLTAAGPSVGFERFATWARAHIDSPLVAWIFDVEQRLAQELGDVRQFNTPESPRARTIPRMFPRDRTVSASLREDASALEELVSDATSSCSSTSSPPKVEEIVELRDTWRTAANESQFGVIDFATFHRLLPTLPAPLAQRLFRACDCSNSGTLAEREWCIGLAVCLRGGAEACRHLCFRMFAEDGLTEGGMPCIYSASAQALRCFANQSSALFMGGLIDKLHRVDTDLVLSSLDAEPWASEALALIRALGHVARVDLNMRPCDPREERSFVDRVSDKFDPERPGEPGASWCLISSRWYGRWCEFTGPDAEDTCPTTPRQHRPPSIDNSALVDQAGWLKMNLGQRRDYEFLTTAAWRTLCAWYGGGPMLFREVIELDGLKELEVYPLKLRVSRTNERGEVLLEERCMAASRTLQLGDVCKMACALYGIAQAVQILHSMSEAPLEGDWQVGDARATLHSLNFIDGHCILLQLFDGSSVVGKSTTKVDTRNPRSVGLQNLGNSCYMNASLQCILHTPMLGQYFESRYCYDLNTEGTWGMAGKIAVAFAELCAELQQASNNGRTAIAPRAFKRTIGDYHPEFAGWRQQDAQEFLSVFLSGLSEDVNRVSTKPYVELKDSDGRPDAEVASDYWNAHCQREQSVISMLFSGQYKSVIRCADCQHENAAYDPFVFVPVPLPEHDFRWITCTLVARPTVGIGGHTTQLCARVPKMGRVSDLLRAVAGFMGLEELELLAADINNHYISGLYAADNLLSMLHEESRPTIFRIVSLAAASPAGSHDIAEPARPVTQASAPHSGVEPAALLAEAAITPAGPHDGAETAVPLVGIYALAARSSCSRVGEAASVPLPAGDIDAPPVLIAKTEQMAEAATVNLIFSAAPTVLPEIAKPKSDGQASVLVFLVQRRLQKVEKYFNNPYRPALFATPGLLRMRSRCTTAELYAAAWRQVKHCVPDFDPLREDRWPFALSHVVRDGVACSKCSWRHGCLGCWIPMPRACDALASDGGHQAPVEELELTSEDTLGIDWDAQVLSDFYKSKIAGHIDFHESVELARLERNAPERLSQCLDRLVRGEELTAYCRECTKTNNGDFTETTHTKTLHVWGCPPLLLLQLKRFHSKSGHSYKLHNLINFPMRLNLQEHLAGAVGKDACAGSEVEASPPEENMCYPDDLKGWDEPLRNRTISKDGGTVPDVALTLSRESVEYNLYAVVNHIGSIDGGHYTAYVRDGQGLWLCCNDSQVYSVSEDTVVSANAYLLFYERLDVVAEINSAGVAHMLSQLFPDRPYCESLAVDPQRVKRAPWYRGKDYESRAGCLAGLSSSGFCGVM